MYDLDLCFTVEIQVVSVLLEQNRCIIFVLLMFSVAKVSAFMYVWSVLLSLRHEVCLLVFIS